MLESYQVILLLAISPFFAIIAFIFYRKRHIQYTYLEFALMVGALFGILVPLDHILNLPIRYNFIFSNLNHEIGGDRVSYEILGVVLAYQAFLLSMIAGTLLAHRRTFSFHKRWISFDKVHLFTENVKIPVLIFVIGLYLFLYISYDINYVLNSLQFSGSLKQIRLQISESGSLSYKLLAISANIFFAFNVFLISSNRTSIRWIAFLSILIISVYRGDRGDIFLALIALIVFHRFRRPSGTSIALIASALVSFFWIFKPVYNFFFEYFTSANPVVFAGRIFSFSFSRIESLSSFEITHYVLYDANFPKILGESYAVLPLVLVPRFIYDGSAFRIGRQYGDLIASNNDGYFGFSPLAEAYVNFGIAGFFLVGLFIGLIIGFIRFPQRSVANLLMFFFLFRFYRSDFASAFKMNFFIYGISFLVAWAVIVSLSFFFVKRRRRRLAISA